MKKILLFYASYGGGHLSAAKSIKEYIENNYSDAQIRIVDCIECTNKTCNKITTRRLYMDSNKSSMAMEHYL